jgi:hypothetical protein
MLLAAMKTNRASGQLSPGDLHKSHAFLDGVENCGRCHDRDRTQVRVHCLECHTELQSRIAVGQGLHAKPEYHDCQKCHVEHQGRDYDLIYWKDGEKNFEHSLTGFTLHGKHATLDCRTCHRDQFIQSRDELQKRKKDFSKTYLGLDTTCVSCHRDEHRGQFAAACSQCHTQDGWRPAPGFNHDKTEFVLTGLHKTKACEKCHAAVRTPDDPTDSVYIKFAGVHHETCQTCHRDVHENQLGDRCENCHTTDGWKSVADAKFDHSKTRFPLEGLHATVACAKCHREGESKRGLKFAACRDCHSDWHNGEFANRPRKGDCEECHSVKGFRPALFTVEQHQQTSFVLRDAHLAVICSDCHGESGARFKSRTGRFTFASTACVDCHPDAHAGRVAKYIEESSCRECHSEVAWTSVQFQHEKTGYRLEGKHAKVACGSCHHRADSTAAVGDIFAPVGRECRVCHTDIHHGQFADSLMADNGVKDTRCERCHTPDDWHRVNFNHNTQTRFALDGAHAKVPCGGCHKPTSDGQASFVVYRMPDISCRACHDSSIDSLRGSH